MKKGLAMLMAAIVMLLPVWTGAEETPPLYDISEDGVLWAYNGPGGIVTIPAAVDGIRVTDVTDYWRYNGGATKAAAYLVEEGCEACIAVDGVLFSVDGKTLYAYPPRKPGSQYRIPDGVETVLGSAFFGVDDLETLSIPASVKSIDYAFRFCTDLRRVIFEDGCVPSMRSAFGDCDVLEAFAVPEGAGSDGDLIGRCSGLRTLLLPADADLSELSPSTFSASENLTVYGMEASSAADYCYSYGVPFRAVPDYAKAYQAIMDGADEPPESDQLPDPAGTPSAWAADELAAARKRGLVPYGMSKSYQGEATREDFCRISAALNDASIRTYIYASEEDPVFTDTQQEDVMMMARCGVVLGYEDGSFRPNNSIKRQEAAVMLFRLVPCSGNAPARFFSDEGLYSGWAADGIRFMLSCVDETTGLPVINGVSRDTFDPFGTYTREQAYAVSLRLYRYLEQKHGKWLEEGGPVCFGQNMSAVFQNAGIIVDGIAEQGAVIRAEGPQFYKKKLTPEENLWDCSGFAAGKYQIMIAEPQGQEYGPMEITVTGGGTYLRQPPTWELNSAFRQNHDDLPQRADRQTTVQDAEAFKNLADEIVAGCATDYEKAAAVHDWVCRNLWYDLDYFNNRQATVSRTAEEALESKKTVCEGFANLMAELLRCVDVPARRIDGYALGIDDQEWKNENTNYWRINHAWLEAYIDGRWMIIDPTWDCVNFFRNGEFSPASDAVISRKYFDIDLFSFSYSHFTSRIIQDDQTIF